MNKPKLIIFSSGTKTGGGSGFENLVSAQKSGVSNFDIVAVVSNHEMGGVRESVLKYYKRDRCRVGSTFWLAQISFRIGFYKNI